MQSSNTLDKGVAFFLRPSIELPHHARFFRIFFGRTMEETLLTTFERSCDGSADQHGAERRKRLPLRPGRKRTRLLLDRPPARLRVVRRDQQGRSATSCDGGSSATQSLTQPRRAEETAGKNLRRGTAEGSGGPGVTQPPLCYLLLLLRCFFLRCFFLCFFLRCHGSSPYEWFN